MQHDAVTENDELYIWSKTTGYMKAWAGETKTRWQGLAYFRVTINSKALPEVLKKIAESFIQPEWTR